MRFSFVAITVVVLVGFAEGGRPGKLRKGVQDEETNDKLRVLEKGKGALPEKHGKSIDNVIFLNPASFGAKVDDVASENKKTEGMTKIGGLIPTSPSKAKKEETEDQKKDDFWLENTDNGVGSSNENEKGNGSTREGDESSGREEDESKWYDWIRPCHLLQKQFDTSMKCEIDLTTPYLSEPQIHFEVASAEELCALSETSEVCTRPIYRGTMDYDDVVQSTGVIFEGVRIGATDLGDISLSHSACPEKVQTTEMIRFNFNTKIIMQEESQNKFCDCDATVGGLECKSCRSCSNGGFSFDCSNLVPGLRVGSDNCAELGVITSVQGSGEIVQNAVPIFLLNLDSTSVKEKGNEAAGFEVEEEDRNKFKTDRKTDKKEVTDRGSDGFKNWIGGHSSRSKRGGGKGGGKRGSSRGGSSRTSNKSGKRSGSSSGEFGGHTWLDWLRPCELLEDQFDDAVDCEIDFSQFLTKTQIDFRVKAVDRACVDVAGVEICTYPSLRGSVDLNDKVLATGASFNHLTVDSIPLGHFTIGTTLCGGGTDLPGANCGGCHAAVWGVPCRSCGKCDNGGFLFDCTNIVPW